MIKKLTFLFFLLVVTNSLTLIGQNDSLMGVNKMRTLVKEQNLSEAKAYLESQIQFFKKNNQPDSLARYIEFVGSYSLNSKNWDKALANTQTYVKELLDYNIPRVSKFAYKELAWIQDESGRPDLAYTSVEKALDFAKKDPENNSPTVDDMYYNMGYYASGMGDYALSKKNYLKSLDIYLTSDEEKYVPMQQVYNALGGLMWREGKMDSCNYYFDLSLKVLAKTKPEPLNQYYRPGLVLMNMAVVSNVLGNNEEAISYSQRAIENFNNYTIEGKDEQKINSANGHKLAAIDNLGVFYNSIGQYKKAEDLIHYSYQQKLKTKSKNDPSIVISKIILAQAKLNTRDFINAKELLDEAVLQIEQNPGIQNFWKASALSTKAKVLGNLGQVNATQEAYEKARIVFLESLNGKYNNELLAELSDMAVFYAQNGLQNLAIERAEEVYQETTLGEFKDTPQGFSFLTSVAEVYFRTGNYQKAKDISDKISLAINNQEDSATSIDQILKRFQLPRVLLLQTKASYQLDQERSSEKLLALSNNLKKAFEILELRQTVLDKYEDVSVLISQNEELIDFSKKIQYELYNKTQEELYLEKLIQLNESSIYNRIRTRLNIKKVQSFGTIPNSILEEENHLKEQLNQTLESDSEKGITQFFEASEAWDKFKESLKKSHPEYYRLRYSNLTETGFSLAQFRDTNQTIVRYFYIDKKLFALILNAQANELIEIDASNIETAILSLQETNFDPKFIGKHTFELYQKLWKPIESYINTETVVIVPAGPLFNLNFEILTNKPLINFQEFIEHALISKHTLSYHFSLAINNSNTNIDNNQNFIAFAPTFNEKMKTEYLLSITDSSSIDKHYLTLLPQPFTKDLVTKYQQTFNGKAYLNKEAIKPLFLKQSKDHKIIHIGTHAESNNINPELSRLVFAKSLQKDSLSNDNSLYAFEIYNYNLQSDLAVLTACETGKPSYQAGEGMISLTHAFTYAGSKSILTSLWSIDEESSAKIVSLFYDNLKQGQSKNKALKNAKLEYLKTHQGRTLAPQYWGGLVLIGDTNPLEISGIIHWVWISLIVIICALIVVFFFRKKSS